MTGGKPFASILLSVGARTLFGLTVGLLYDLAKRSRYPLAGILLVTSVGRTIHSFFVYAFMEILFPETKLHVTNALSDMLRWDYPLFLVVADLLVMFCYGISRTRGVRQFWLRIRMADQMNPSVSHRWGKTVIMIGLLLFSSVSVALYFTNRIENVMTRYGLIVSERVSYDLMHLQIQFLMGILSLAVIAVIMVVLYLKNFNYLYYEARMDGLTGLMRREQFFQAGKARLEKMWNKGAKKAG